MSPLFALLTKEIGAPMARALFDALNQRATRAKLARVEGLINTGATALGSLRRVFGKEFADAVRSISPAPNGWTYEAGTKDYVRLPIDGLDLKHASAALRDELNVNLDRIVQVGGDPGLLHNYLRGTVSVWLDRFEQRLGHSDPRVLPMVIAARKRLKATEGIASKLLRLTGLASIVAGVMLLVKAAMLFLCFGIGLFALISALLFGVPFLAIAVLVLVGALLIASGGTVVRRRSSISAAAEAVEAAYAALDALGGRTTHQ